MTFRPALLIVSAISLAFLMALGVWQLQRLEWKEGLIEAMAVRSTLTPLSPANFIEAARRGADIDYFPVRLEGAFRADEQIRFITSAISDRERTDVYMPLDTADGRLWVHIGVAGPDQRVIAPATGSIGVARRVERPNRFVPANRPDTQGWFWPDIEAMDPGNAALTSHYLALQPAFDSQSDDFTLDNPRAAPRLTNNHLGYALTWFGMAAGLVIIVFLMSRKPRR